MRQMKDIEEIMVGDAMTRGVICLDIKDTIRLAAEVMKKNDISGLVVTEKGEGVGVLTERDIICKVVALGKDPENTTAEGIMTSPLITIDPKASIDDAARVMRDRDIRRLAVSIGDRIIGIISEFDIVKLEPALHLLIKEQASWSLYNAEAAISGGISGICESCENYSDALKNIDGRLVCDECIP